MSINLHKIKKTYLDQPAKMKFIYAKHWKKPLVANAILFESFHGKNVSDSPLHMLQELMRQGRAKDFTIYYATDGNPQHRQLVKSLGLPVQLVDILSEDYARVLATSTYLVNNSSFPAWFIRRDGQRYIQTWHGTPLKTLGKRMRNGIESMYNVQHNFLQANVITFPNAFTREVIMRDYNLEPLFCNTVAMLGYPRNDVFMAQDPAPVRQRYGLEGRSCFAYMPTWRGKSNHDVNVDAYAKELKRILTTVDDALGDDQILFVNLHSMVASKIKLGGYKHVKPFPKDADNYEFLNAMDALVTDYSSVFFDFALTHKPVILFTYDIDEYLSDRGLYLDIQDMPFTQVSTAEQLVECLRSGSYAGQRYWEGSFGEYLKYDSADNAAKALQLLFDGEAPGVPLDDYSHNAQREWQVLYPLRQRHVADVATMCQSARPGELVVFDKNSFTEDMSAYLHDEFRDAFPFLFTINSVPRTYAEELLSRVSRAKARELQERNMRRIFGPLKIAGEPRQTAFVPQTGCCIVENKRDGITIDGKNTAAVMVGNVDNKLRIELADDSYEYRRILYTVSAQVVWSRDITPEERAQGAVITDLREAAKARNTKLSSNVRIVFSGYRKGQEGGEQLLIVPVVSGSTTQNNPVFITKPFFLELSSFTQEEIHDSNYLSGMQPQDNCALLTQARAADGALQLKLAKRDDYLRYLVKGTVKKLKVSPHAITVGVELSAPTFQVSCIKLRYRSADEDIVFELPTTVRQTGSGFEVSTTFDPRAYDFKEIYWDFRVGLHNDELGIQMDVPALCPFMQRARMVLGNVQAALPGDKIIFSNYARGTGSLHFVYRTMSEYDSPACRRREVVAYALFRLTKPFWAAKRIWLVHEKFCSTAQDNGFYFFKYCMDELPPQERAHIFYVMDKNAKDRDKLAGYEGNVLDFMSFKHLLYGMAADIVIASDSTSHLFTWRPKPSAVAHVFKRKKTLFLQHGVTALKRVDYIFGKKGTSPMTYFLTTSSAEQRIVVGHFGYSAAEAPVLGFSRWDVLEDRSDSQHPKILIMPTWRQWLEEQSEEVFVGSEYYQRYSQLIQSPRFARLLEEHDATASFFIHPKLSEHLSAFATSNPRIELIAQGSVPLNELMMESSMLITDYSSVCWDMLYMDKPVCFYQFDKERYCNVVGSYIDFDQDLPGDSCESEDELLSSVEASLARGCVLTERDAQRASNWYDYKDTNNRQRTYEFLISQQF